MSNGRGGSTDFWSARPGVHEEEGALKIYEVRSRPWTKVIFWGAGRRRAHTSPPCPQGGSTPACEHGYLLLNIWLNELELDSLEGGKLNPDIMTDYSPAAPPPPPPQEVPLSPPLNQIFAVTARLLPGFWSSHSWQRRRRHLGHQPICF